jgi:hypothetical protein
LILAEPAAAAAVSCRSGRAARAGRSGTSYSFVTREEVPYLLDLHLYLGRTLVPAPQTPDAEAVRAAATHGVAGVSSGGGSVLCPVLAACLLDGPGCWQIRQPASSTLQPHESLHHVRQAMPCSYCCWGTVHPDCATTHPPTHPPNAPAVGTQVTPPSWAPSQQPS